MTEPIDIIRGFSDNFRERHSNNNLTKMLPDLREQLDTLDSLKSKRTFLKYIKLDTQQELEKHIIEHHYGKPKPDCGIEEHSNKFIFFINQELEMLDKFEEKDRKNFLQQFDNNTIITTLIAILVPLLGASFYLGTQQAKTDFLEKELFVLREASANSKANKEVKDSAKNNNTKDRTYNFRRNKHKGND